MTVEKNAVGKNAIWNSALKVHAGSSCRTLKLQVPETDPTQAVQKPAK